MDNKIRINVGDGMILGPFNSWAEADEAIKDYRAGKC